MSYANTKGTDQPVHPRNLISAFVVHCVGSIISLFFYIQNFKPLASLCSWSGRIESYLVENSEDMFSRDVAVVTMNVDPFLALCHWWLLSYVLRKPDFAICEQQRRRSACAATQSDQHLCCLLPPKYNTSSFSIRNFKPLPSFFGCAGRFVSYLVANP